MVITKRPKLSILKLSEVPKGSIFPVVVERCTTIYFNIEKNRIKVTYMIADQDIVQEHMDVITTEAFRLSKNDSSPTAEISK